MSYTPGPWAVGQYTPSPEFLAITNHTCVCDPQTMALIATCGRAGDPQSQLDADLIAAAPDLLAALERIANSLEEEHDGEEFAVAFAHAQQIAREAIAVIEAKHVVSET